MNAVHPDQTLQRPAAVKKVFYVLWAYLGLNLVVYTYFTVRIFPIMVAQFGNLPALHALHPLNAHQIKLVEHIGVVAATVVILLIFLFQLLVVFKAYHGRRWARNFLLVFAVFGLLSMVFSFTTNPRFLIAPYEHSFLHGIFSSINNLVFLMTVYAVVFLFVNKQAKAFYQGHK